MRVMRLGIADGFITIRVMYDVFLQLCLFLNVEGIFVVVRF